MSGLVLRDAADARQAWLRAASHELAALRVQCAAIRLMLVLKHNFDPNEPRIPAGEPGGVRWTRVGGAGLARAAAGDEDEKKPEEEFDPLGEVRDASFNQSYREIRRLDPANPMATYVSDGSAPSWDTVNAYQNELEAVRTRVSDKIASGHAFDDHAAEFGVTSRSDFAAIIRQVISSPLSQVRDLTGGRTKYYDVLSNTVVFVQPVTRDGGSMFKPVRGQAYIDEQ